MLWGLLLHTATLGDFGAIEAVSTISDWFRMSTFFLVSGFFAVMLHDRYGAGRFLRNRYMALAIPLVTTLLLLNPITLWLVFRFHNGDAFPDFGWMEVLSAVNGTLQGAEGPMIWHLHLWFLISLLFFATMAVPLVPVLAALLARYRVQPTLDRIPRALMPLVVACAVTLSVLVMRLVFKIAIEPVFDSWVIRATLSYWPYFILGMLLFMTPGLWALLHRIDPLTIAASAGVTALALLLKDAAVSSTLTEVFSVAGWELGRCAAIFALLYLFRRFFDKANEKMRSMSRSIYSVYLVHYLTIYALANAFKTVWEVDAGMYFVVVTLTLLITTMLHRHVIEKVDILMFLLNGKVGLRGAVPVPAERAH